VHVTECFSNDFWNLYGSNENQFELCLGYKRKEPMNPKVPQSLGQVLRAARIEAGLSTRQVAKLAELTHGYLVKMENDQIESPSAAYLARLADVLELDTSDLLGFIGVEPSSILPSPRVYFRRKFGISEAEAERLSRLIAGYTKPPNNSKETHDI
jgi:transcriptional regulator with XRE-family HTH domain